MELDTFLTAVYCIVDDLYRRDFAPLKPAVGRPATLSDSEVLTLALLGQWQQRGSERAFLRYAQHHWRHYFPRFISQSTFNRRLRALTGVLCRLAPAVAAAVQADLGPAAYEVLDTVPVPLMRRCRGQRRRCFGEEAAIGYGGSDRDWYYGVSLLVAVDARGFITGMVEGPANTEARWLAEALFRWRQDALAPQPQAVDLVNVLPPPHRGPRQGPTGRLGPRAAVGRPGPAILLADRGFSGKAWQAHWRDAFGLHVLTNRTDSLPWCSLSRRRQLVEQTFATLHEGLHLKLPRARTYWGLIARLAAKAAAFNVHRYINYRYGIPLGTAAALAC